MKSMPNYCKNDIILVRYPFSDLSSAKVRPAVIISEPHPSQDVVIVPLTSKVTNRQRGEFVLQKWSESGLNVPTAVKRGFFTIQKNLILKVIGQLGCEDAQQLQTSVRYWLGL